MTFVISGEAPDSLQKSRYYRDISIETIIIYGESLYNRGFQALPDAGTGNKQGTKKHQKFIIKLVWQY